MTPADTPEAQAGPPIILSDSRSRTVSWSEAHAEIWPVVERALRHGPLPLIGTQAWLDLRPGDPRRVGSVYLAADLHALHIEADQAARIEATEEIAAALPWSTIVRSGQQRREWLAANPWAVRRVVA